MVLSRRVLSNEIEEGPTDEWDTVTTIATFNATYRFYWGQIAGLIKALPASASTLSNPQQNKLTDEDETKVTILHSSFWKTTLFNFIALKNNLCTYFHFFYVHHRRLNLFGVYLSSTTEAESLRWQLNYNLAQAQTSQSLEPEHWAKYHTQLNLLAYMGTERQKGGESMDTMKRKF